MNADVIGPDRNRVDFYSVSITVEDTTMINSRENPNKRLSLKRATKQEVSRYLYEVYSDVGGLLGTLDGTARQRVTSDNMAKLERIFNAEDAAEACYSDLIRELDAEAESGIFLAYPDSPKKHLRRVCDEPGVSGTLAAKICTIAPILFSDEAAQGDESLVLAWVSLYARHDRAHVDATISEIIMSHILDNVDAARDMSTAIRALQYPFHENIVRSRCELPRLLKDRDVQDLMIMVSELAKRSGQQQVRHDAIRDKMELN